MKQHTSYSSASYNASSVNLLCIPIHSHVNYFLCQCLYYHLQLKEVYLQYYMVCLQDICIFLNIRELLIMSPLVMIIMISSDIYPVRVRIICYCCVVLWCCVVLCCVVCYAATSPFGRSVTPPVRCCSFRLNVRYKHIPRKGGNNLLLLFRKLCNKTHIEYCSSNIDGGTYYIYIM